MPITRMIFKGVPLPPSSNYQYVSFVRHGKIIHAPSKDLNQFKKDMVAYWFTQSEHLKFAREAFTGHALSIHIEFRFEASRIFTKKGSFKRLDVSNRLKSIHDSISQALLIDDCAFTKISAEKVAVETKAMEQAIVTIEIADFVSYN